MKRILSAMLVCVLVFGLVACGTTKTMEQPKVNLELKDVTFESFGEEVKDTVVVSPLSTEKFKPEVALEAIKKLSFLSGWESKTQYSEVGTPVFTDAGQMTSFKSAITLNFYETKGKSYEKSISVFYNCEPDSVLGYSAVAVEFSNDSAGKCLSEKQRLEVLKAVFGEEYAEYLCYAKMPTSDGLESSEMKQGNASLTYERISDKTMGYSYAMRVTNNDATQVNGNPGDFEPTLESMAILRDLLNMKEGDSPLDLKNMGTDFLTKHFGEGTHFELGTGYLDSMAGAYLYSDADGYKTLMMRYYLAQDGVEENNRLRVTLSTSLGEFEETYVNFQLGTVAKDASEDAREELRQKALAIAKDVLGMEELEDAFAEDKYFNATINDKDVLVIFRLHWDENDDGSTTATLSFASTTDLKFFEKTE